MLDLMKDYPDAFRSMKKAKSNYNAAMVFGFIGGFCIGYPLGQALAGSDPSWAMAGIGVGFIIVSIPLSNAYNTHAKAAINLYNSKIRQASSTEIQLEFGFTGDGVGLTCRF